MPFDASGNFTRNYNFQQDRDNGIKILAARVDGEFDNVATGMNLVFFRDGRVPMQADLRMNINGIQGLKDGALGSPAIKFNTDANTGVYLDGLSRYAVQVNSVQRGVFTTTGFDVTGNFTASGTISEGGTSLPSKYAALAGATFTGPVAATTFTTAGSGGGFFAIPRDATVGNTIFYSSTANRAAVSQNSADQLVITPTGTTVSGLLTGNGNARINGTGSGTALILDDHSNASGVNVQFTGNGATTPNKSIRVINGQLQVTNSAYSSVLVTVDDTGNLTTVGSLGSPIHNVTGASGALTFAPRDATGGAAIIYSPTNKSISLNDGAGSDIVQFNASGTANLIKSGYIAGGVQGSYNVGYSNSRTGQVGYHMYNGGGVTEWVIYQPAHATGDEFRIGNAAAGSISDRLKITSGGATTVSGVLQSDDFTTQRASAPTTGALFFGNSGSKYLYWDASNFQLSASLVVGGNISSSSDIRLKSNVRPLENGMAFVRALQGKRFNMYGKSDFGFVAQDVERILPEVVSRDSKGYLSVDYGRLTAVLAEAVKSLDDRLSAVERFLVV